MLLCKQCINNQSILEQLHVTACTHVITVNETQSNNSGSVLTVNLRHCINIEFYVGTTYYSCATECPLLYIYSVPSVVNCSDPGTPTNGQHNLPNTTYNSVVTYTCDVGYTLQGSNSRTCQSNGKWSGSVPQCNGMSVKRQL